MSTVKARHEDWACELQRLQTCETHKRKGLRGHCLDFGVTCTDSSGAAGAGKARAADRVPHALQSAV